MNKSIEPNKIYSVQEVADLLGVSSTTVVEYCRTGKIIAQKVGEWKILGQALIVFMGMNKLVTELTPILNDHVRLLNQQDMRIRELEENVKQILKYLNQKNS